jgi:hypothetical protein
MPPPVNTTLANTIFKPTYTITHNSYASFAGETESSSSLESSSHIDPSEWFILNEAEEGEWGEEDYIPEHVFCPAYEPGEGESVAKSIEW